MLQLSSKLTPLAQEAHNVLTGRYPENAAGRAAQATMAIINHDQDTAKLIITELSRSPEGINAILSELQYLEREGWYRSLRDFLRHVPQVAFENYQDKAESVGNLLGNAYSRMRSLGVNTVADTFKAMISLQHPLFVKYLSDKEVELARPSPTDRIVHTLREGQTHQGSEDILPQSVVAAFDDYLLRNRLSWAAELLNFCHASPELKSALLRHDAVDKLVEKMMSTESVVTLRFFAHVVRDKNDYRGRFVELLGIVGA